MGASTRARVVGVLAAVSLIAMSAARVAASVAPSSAPVLSSSAPAPDAASPLVSVTSSSVALTADTHRIRLQSGHVIDPSLGEPAISDALRESSGPVGGRRSLIVYYGDADPEATRRDIVAAGGLVVGYLPDHALLIRLGSEVEMSFAAPGAWVGAFQPAYKLSPLLAKAAATPLTLSVLLFPDGDLDAASIRARDAGAEVLATSNRVNRLLRVRGDGRVAEALARDPNVAWIEPYVAPEALNDQVQGLVQTGVVGDRRLWDLGLHGEGQVLMTSDTGLNVQHFAFRDPAIPITDFGSYPSHRKVIAYAKGSTNPGITFGDYSEFHGTHTAGTAAGNDDVLGTSTRDGLAKAAKLWFVDLSGPVLDRELATPTDLNDLYEPSYVGNGGGAARIASSSWGADLAGAYTVDAYAVDQFMWTHPQYLMLFANGNAGGMGTVASPASAKNCVSVGASGNGVAQQDFLAGYSSRGPTLDGRLKPTVCAPGGVSFGGGVWSANKDSVSYAENIGTSMACPAVAGTAALMRQYLVEGWYPTGAPVPGNGFTPSAALLKAMCVNSACNEITGYMAPDVNVGWGRIAADSVLYFTGDARRLLLVDQTQGLAHGEAVEYVVNVSDGSQPLKASLCWTDAPGLPSAGVQLVNDLDLIVTRGATAYRGNVFSNGFSVTGGSADNRDVEEGVRIASPAAGLWTLRIEGRNVPAGPQPFALVVTGGLGTSAGALTLDRASYGPTGTVTMQVTDTNAGSGVSVSIASTSEPAGEVVSLAGAAGVLAGSISLSPFAGGAGDGVLRVSNGDAITAHYTDTSPPATLTATATVRIETPVITNVHIASAGTGAALIQWTTNVDTDSRVHWGPTSALGSTATAQSAAVREHAVTLTGLTPGQTYLFDVESRDAFGNAARDDQGGLHYRVTASQRADILIVFDGLLFERSDRYASALAATGWSYDVWVGDAAETPRLGDSSTGLRSYKAVWWQNGYEHYPPFANPALDSVAAYVAGGGRLAVVGHDLAWANQDPSSASYTPERASWMQNTLHTQFVADPQIWSGVTGIPGDPISGGYAGGAPYTPFRIGAGGDEVTPIPGAGTATTDWQSGDGSPSTCGFRWESATPLGTPGVGVWGGAPTRLATMFFEWSAMAPANDPSSIRNEVLQNTLAWLIGRDKPHVTVQGPSSGQVIGGGAAAITWVESIAPGTSVASRTLDYSLDAGASWTTITTSAPPSPYVWNVSGVSNSIRALVRVRVTDSGSPALSGVDASDAVFTIAHPGGDVVGPVVVAGSVHVSPNPIDNQALATLTASVTDVPTGGAAVSATEWSAGETAAAPGAGAPMSGSFGSVTVSTSASLATSTLEPGVRSLWVRGRDAQGNWGTAARLAVVVNGTQPLAVGEPALDYALGPAIPNPALARARLSYSLPARGAVDLAVFDVSGRRVKSLVQRDADPGVHTAEWDLRDDRGHLVQAGVYYYRLAVGGRTFTRRLVALH